MDTMVLTYAVVAVMCAMAWYCCYRMLRCVAAAEAAAVVELSPVQNAVEQDCSQASAAPSGLPVRRRQVIGSPVRAA